VSADGGGPGGDGGGAAPSPPPARRPLPPSPPPTIDPWLRALPLLGLATLTGVLCWVYAGVFRGEVCGDDNSYHFAEAAFLADALRQGDLDWWNPAANAGFPSGYYYQLVPAAIPGVLAAIFGGVLFWFQLTIFLSMVLVPAATYRGLRLMGAEPWPALGGALAVSFVLSGSKWGAGAEGVFWVGLYTQGVAMVAYPLALGSGWRWLVHGRGAAPAVAWGLFVGLCHPVAGVCLGLALAVALPVALVEQAGRERRRHLGPPLRLFVLGLLLVVGSASAWLQVLVDYEAFGGFPHRVAGEAGPGFATLQSWLRDGYFLDHERRPPRVLTGLMVPALVLALVCFALRRHRHLAALWLSALFFAYVLGVGPSLRTDDDLFPAVRVMGALQVSLAMAIGAGLVAGAVAAIRGLEPLRHGDVGQGAIAFLLFLAMIGVAAPAVDQHRGRVRVAEDYERIHRAELDELLPAIRAATPGRIQNRGGTTARAPGVENHWFMILPYVYAGRSQLVVYGAAALQSSPNFVYLHGLPTAARAAWIYDAPLVLTNHERGPAIGGTLLASTEHFELRELPAPGLVSGVQVVGALPPGDRKRTRAAVLAWQRSDAPMRDQVLAHAGHGGAGPPPDGEVLEVRRGASTITARVEARATTTFVIRESWHPRWTATVDGRPARLRRVTPDFLALDVGPGEHLVRLSFERPWWQWALWLLAPLAAALGAWCERRLAGLTRGRAAAAARA
ncbi:MAG: hypothetical protein HS111_37430, partial [Kofleriaceae bacterium]|nr:hypothetical protein [Kofleriaceae bacterium]